MKIGFIGAGNMAGAMIRGILKGKKASPGEIMASDVNAQALAALTKETDVKTGTNKETAAFAEVLFLAVKPQFFEGMLKDIAPALSPETVVVSIAPGKTIAWIRETLGCPCRLIRTMPNTPALVGEGMTAICDNTTFSKEDFNYAKGIFDSVGKTKVLPERLFDGVVAVSGSSPAYVYMMIEAMADAAVKEGIPRVHAYEMAAQSVLGSALMVLSTGTHPAALKDAVCSPGGTTIEAVEELERKGFRAAIMDAMKVCAEKSREMSK